MIARRTSSLPISAHRAAPYCGSLRPPIRISPSLLLLHYMLHPANKVVIAKSMVTSKPCDLELALAR